VYSPACENQGTFTTSSPQPFLSIEPLGIASFNLKIEGAVLAHRGVYAMQLRASVDGKTGTHNFSQEIVDSCDRTSFETSPAPLTDMTVVLASSAIQT